MIASHRTCISGQANYHHLPMFKLYKFLWRHCQPWDGKVLHFPSAGPLQILQSDSPSWWNDELNRTSLNSKHTSSCLSNATDVLPLLPRVKSSMCGSFSRSPMRCLQRMHCHLLPTVFASYKHRWTTPNAALSESQNNTCLTSWAESSRCCLLAVCCPD